jgi:hypothetical protein
MPLRVGRFHPGQTALSRFSLQTSKVAYRGLIMLASTYGEANVRAEKAYYHP